MKKLFIVAAVAAISFSSCGGGSVSLKTEADSLAYTVGVLFGESALQIDTTLNVDMMTAGFKAAYTKSAKMDAATAENFWREYNMVRVPAKNKKASEEFLESVEKNNKNIKKTESGLLYEIIEAGDLNEMATPESQVKVFYTGALKDGKEFDSPELRGFDTVSLPLNQVVAGWSEGLQLVGKGGKIKLWIPAELGYGEYGNRGIAPNEALVFDVELVEILPAAEK